MRPAIGVVAILVVGVASCSSSHQRVDPDEGSGRTCVHTDSTQSPEISHPDLADFIYHDGAFYYAVAAGSPLPELREQLGRISCTLADSLTPLSLEKPREGLAGFVKAGTAYFAIKECSSHDAIAAERSERLRVFLRQRPTNEAPAVRDALERKCAHAVVG
jgi:hypothetical protein